MTSFRTGVGLQRARRAYINRSSNDAAFEFFCFERVFIIRRFLQSRGLERCFHLDSDCVLLRSLADFPFHRHAVWLLNNDYYHMHGFSPLPSASIHAALLSQEFCEKFEELYHQARSTCTHPAHRVLAACSACALAAHCIM